MDDANHAAGDVTISHAELAQLLAVATMYVDAFHDGEVMTLPEKLALPRGGVHPGEVRSARLYRYL